MTHPPPSTQLRRAREAKGMTIEQVASKLGWHVTAVEVFEESPTARPLEWLLSYLEGLNYYAIVNGPDGAFVVSKNQDVRR